MPIKFACQHCKTRLKVSSSKAGRQARCPRCQKVLTVPAVELPAPAPVPPPAPAPTPAIQESGAFSEFVVYDNAEWGPDAKAEFVDVDFSRVAVPRGVLLTQGVLLAAVAVGCFAFGFYVGRGQTTAESTDPRLPTPCVIAGRVVFQAEGQEQADQGCVVIVVPRDELPGEAEKIATDSLRPGDNPPSATHAGLLTIRNLGGDLNRTNENGEFQVKVRDIGAYFVLCLSRNSTRDGEIGEQDLTQLGRYFQSPSELVGNANYRWLEQNVQGDTQVNVAF